MKKRISIGGIVDKEFRSQESEARIPGARGRRGYQSVFDCLVGQPDCFIVEVESPGGVELSHEDRNQVFFRIDHESGVIEPSPVIRTDRAQLRQEPGLARDAKSETVTHFVELSLDMVLADQFHRLAAQQARAARLAAVEHHLAKSIIIFRGRAKAAAPGEIGSRSAVGIICRVAEIPFLDDLLVEYRLKSLVRIIGVGRGEARHFLFRQEEARILHAQRFEDALLEKLIERHPGDHFDQIPQHIIRQAVFPGISGLGSDSF